MAKTRSKTVAPGLRALQASGDGHWEMDLVDGSTWFSEWFYTTLAWSPPGAPKTLAALQPHIVAADWQSLLRDIRLHLEERVPLDCEVRLRCPDEAGRWWQIRGAAQWNAARKPVFLGGIVRDVSAARARLELAARELAALRHNFDGLLGFLQGSRAEMALDYADVSSATKRRLRLEAMPAAAAGKRMVLVTSEDDAREGVAAHSASEVN